MHDTRDTIVAHNLGEVQVGLDVLKFFGLWLGKWLSIFALMLTAVGAVALYAIKVNLI